MSNVSTATEEHNTKPDILNDTVSTRAYANNLRRPIPLNKTGFQSATAGPDAGRHGSVTLERRVSEVPLGGNVLHSGVSCQQSTAQGIGNGDPI